MAPRACRAGKRRLYVAGAAQKDCLPASGGFVYRHDDLQRRSAGLRIGSERRAVKNGIDEIADLQHVAGVADGLRIGGADVLCRLTDGQSTGNGQVPADDAVLLEHDAARVAADFDAPRIARAAGRGGFQCADRAVFKLQNGCSAVLDLDAARQCARERVHAAHGAHQMAEHIDAVDALVHERAAAIHRPGAAPGGGGVVFVRAEVLHRQAPGDDAPERARIKRAADLTHGRGEAELRDDADLRAGFPLGGDECVGLLERQAHRLFADDVLARAHGCDALRRVQPAGCADAYRVHIVPGEQRVEAFAGDDAGVCGGEALCAVKGATARSDKPGLGDGLHGLCVKFGDAAAADDAETNGIAHDTASVNVLTLRYTEGSVLSNKRAAGSVRRPAVTASQCPRPRASAGS